MTITYILGNGFDVQLGLRSRYSDFLDEYTVPAEKDSDNIKAFKEMLRNEPDRKLWSAAEKAMGQHLGKYSDKTIDIYTERILDFEEKMIAYLEAEQNRLCFDRKDEICRIFADFVLNSFSDVLNGRSHEMVINSCKNNTFNFLSFNYTNLIDRILGFFPNKILRRRGQSQTIYTDQIGQTIHVHGTLDSQIIMGVNDVEQLDVTGGVTITERLEWLVVKPVQNTQTNTAWDTAAKTAISNSDIIAIYGVSFGETDRIWWNNIKNWLKASKAHKLIFFKREQNKIPHQKLPGQMLKYEDDIRRDILKKLNIEDSDTEKLRSQVFVILNTQRLNIKNVFIPLLPGALGPVDLKNNNSSLDNLALVGR